MTANPTLFRGDSDPVDRNGFLTAADRIGAELVRDAVWAGRSCNWLGWMMKPVDGYFQPVFGSCPIAFYDGLAGIALFLAHLTLETGDRHQKQALWGAISGILAATGDLTSPGYYSGLAGVGHALARIGGITGSGALVENGVELLRKAAAMRAEPPAWDVLSGSAGLIPALLDLASRHGEMDLVELAEGHGRDLVAAAVPSPAGLSWPAPGGTVANLLGYSHGTAGVACALLELYAARPDEVFRQTAMAALRYERSHFSVAEKNWPDYREQPGKPSAPAPYPVAWCHGAGGIGLARLRVLELLGPDEELLAEIDAALQRVSGELASAANPQQRDFTYCHGGTGLAEFLLQCAVQFGRDDIRQAVASLGQFGIDQFQSRGMPWPCGVPGVGESPSLMLGTSGIGYFYLRLHDAEAHPPVLLLRPAGKPQSKTTEPPERPSGGGSGHSKYNEKEESPSWPGTLK